jgi:hypothetical protein
MRDETLDDYLERNNLFLCRELTDEEIMELSYLTSDNDPIEFARAILRKAQEK